MAVFLAVLKIIGIVLLSVLLLALAIILIVLFVPVRYKARCNKENPDSEIEAEMNASFLLHIISAWIKYEDGFDYYIKVFGIKIRKKKESIDEDDSKTERDSKTENDSIPEIDPKPVLEENIDYSVDWNDESPAVSEGPLENDTQFSENDNSSSKDIGAKFESFVEGISEKYSSFIGKIKGIGNKLSSLSTLSGDTKNQTAISYIYNETVKMLKKFIPRRVRGFVHFGFDDPGTTGKVLMYLGILYPILPQGVIIDPGFDDTDIYGNLDLKGRITIIHLAVLFVKLLMKKEVRRLWKLYKKES